MDCSLAMAMVGLQWQLAMMSANSLHSVAAMMRDHLCWLHLYVVDKEEYAGGGWCKILRSSKLLEVSDTDR